MPPMYLIVCLCDLWELIRNSLRSCCDNLLKIWNRKLDSDFGIRAWVSRGIPSSAFPLCGNLETSFWSVSIKRWCIFCYTLNYILLISALILLMIVHVMTYLTYIWWVLFLNFVYTTFFKRNFAVDFMKMFPLGEISHWGHQRCKIS